MSADFIAPRYADLALANLLPSVVARLEGNAPIIDIPVARRYVVLLVDGLGWHQLDGYSDHAEVMSHALPGALRLTCSVPSTTATSLTSLGCGCGPGEHGVVGYTFREPTVDRVVNALSWDGGPEDIAAFAQTPTQFELLARRGEATSAVMLKRFGASALTRLAFGGAQHRPIELESDQHHVAELINEALTTERLVYAYERMLDHDGHGFGVGSWQWLERLASVDDLVATLAETLPADTCLLVTGDHGMVNIPLESRIVAEETPALGGYDVLGGEPRFRHIYTTDPARLAASWRRELGDRALVLRREEAVEAGWFGPRMTETSLARIGDVVAAMTGDFAVMSLGSPGEFGLVGMHGSLTATEMEVPLLMLGGSR
ncbi:alkaline phosphatase family protein [Tessaracoccus defluvii]|uniref:Alkaline phosphatase family protein n=1 Tax=Tessaracoccus defluvii TaxID=1285901 RepID=A0A7H0H8K9_9ACTN|nr:alkaline phosphatase family protein [Tessaracoccus defluvii]QNP56875.1 alkaline phosphatase family protein [Tessaracoccus defluvii]